MIAATACTGSHMISVTNPSETDREEVMAEIDADAVVSMADGEPFRLIDKGGEEIPYQLTYDGKLIFPVSVKSGETKGFIIEKGEPAPVDSLVYGRFVPERKDDMAWENDRGAYRAYGPALQQSGERAFGYDIWTKCVPHKVLDRRYYDDKVNKISFHVDHGEGMDVYAVGNCVF